MSTSAIGALAAARRRSAGGGPATYTLQETIGAGASTAISFGASSATKWRSSAFVPAASYTLTKVEVRIARVGTSPGDVTAYLYADNGSGAPGTLVATSSSTVTAADVGTSQQWATWLFAGVALTGGVQYHLVLSAASVSATDYWNNLRTGSGWVSGNIYRSANGSSWTSEQSSRQLYFLTYVSP